MNSNNYLLTGESFTIDKKVEDSQKILSNEEINKKYRKGEIRIITEQARYPLDTIATMLDSGKYELNPGYQRRRRWGNEKKSRLIESFIMNVPIPPIFLYEVDYSFYEVMDGLQRLTAIYDFYTNVFKLEGLEYWKELNGIKYHDLPKEVRRGVDRRYLSSIVLLQETAKSDEEAEFLKQTVFERLNSGGALLTPQETRNALHNGKFNQFCIKLGRNEYFRKMWDLPLESEKDELLQDERYRKMEDVELVLRFFAYRHIKELSGMTIERFLDEYLKQANNYPEDTFQQLETLFNNTVEVIYKIFDNTAFLLPQVGKRQYAKPTKTIYDGIMQAFAINIGNKDTFIKKADAIKQNLYINPKLDVPIKRTDRYIFNSRNITPRDIQKRIDFYHDFLQDYIS